MHVSSRCSRMLNVRRLMQNALCEGLVQWAALCMALPAVWSVASGSVQSVSLPVLHSVLCM